jgi:hypothetical protein
MQEYKVVVSRVITSQRFAPVFIKSKQERILDFAETRQMLSVFPFSASYATKAATSGGKRGNAGRANAAADNKDKRKKETKLKRFGIYNFDPKATKKPNQYFETRPRVNLDGQMGDVANVGWLDMPKTIKIQNFNRDAKRYFASKANEPKIIARNAKINKRTGELKVKALGQSIGSVGGNIGQAAARAVGIVLDPSGRMRCPPGVPAANQFTDEIGSNCFDFTPAIGRAVMDVIKKAGQRMLDDIRAVDSALPLVSDGSGGVSRAPKATMDRVRRGLASSTGRVIGTILGPDGKAIPSPDFERDVAELTATVIPIDPADYESVFETLIRAAYPDKTEVDIRRLVKTAVQRQTMRDKTKSDIQEFLDLADELGVSFDKNDPTSTQNAIAQIIGILQSPEGGGWDVDMSGIYGGNPGDKDFAKKMLNHRVRQLTMVTDYLATDPQKFGFTFDDLDILVRTKYAGKFENLHEAILEVLSGRKGLSEVFPPGSMEEAMYLAVARKFEGLQQHEAGMFIGLINQRKKYPQLTSRMKKISYIDWTDPQAGDSDAITWASEDGKFEVGINPMRPLINNEAVGSNTDGFTLFEPDGGMGTEVAKLMAISRSLDREGARRIRDEYLGSLTNLADLQDAIDSGNEYVQRYVERSQGPIGQSIHVINHEMIHGRQLVLVNNYLRSIPGLVDNYTNLELMELTEGLLSGKVTFPSVFGRDWDYASIIGNSDWLPGAIDDLPEVMQTLIGKNAGGKYAMEHYYEAAFLAPFVNGDPGNIKELYLPLSELYAQIEEMDRAGETNSTKCQAALRVFNMISEVYNSGDDEKFAKAKEEFRIQTALVFAEMQAEVAAGVESGFIKRTPEIDAFLGPLNIDTDITTDFGKVNPDAKPIISLTKDSLKQGIKDSIARQKRRRKNRKIIDTPGLLPDDLYITATESGLSSMSAPDSDAFFDGISAFPSRVDVSRMGSTVHNHIMDSATSQQKQILDGNWREAKWNTSDPVDWSRALQSNPDSVVNSIENQLIPFIDLVDSSEMPTNVVVEVHMPPNYISEATGTTIAIDKHHTGIMRSTDDLMDDLRGILDRQVELDRIEKEKEKARQDRDDSRLLRMIADYEYPKPYRGEQRYGSNRDPKKEAAERNARLMVTVMEGQMGLPDNTPGTNRGEMGALILPPGEIEIIGKTTDGVSIGKIVSQKRADEQLNGLKQILHSLGENETRPLGQRIVAKRAENRIARHSELTSSRVAKPAVLMELDPKNSSIANKIEYDPQTRTLTVSYRNGQKREFQNVPYGRLRDAGTKNQPDKLIRDLEGGPERYTPRKGSVRNRGLSSGTFDGGALIREALETMPDDDDAYDEKWQNYLASLMIEPLGPRRLVETATIEEAIMALLDGHEVDMPDIAGAHTLIEDLAKMVSTLEQMVKDGEIDDSALKNFVFDLCQVTVQGTSAFCLGNKGIPRFMMPQAAGQVVPGSAAERLLEKQNAERLAKGEKISDEVEGTEEFLAYLLEKGGITAGEPERVASDKLKATQRDMQGHKVAGMLGAKKAGKYDPSKKPIFVSRDGYVVDGHHRWAATLGADFEDGILGNDHLMNVIVLDAPISQILRLANEWTDEFGIAKKPVAKRSDVDPDFSSSVVQQVKKRAGLSSSTSLVQENLSVLQERSLKADERVTNLESALDVLGRTGEWRGDEFGVVVSIHDDWISDAGKFDADIPPVNLTKEEIEKKFGSVSEFVNLVEDKLDRSRMEADHARYFSKSKQTRIEQNTIDVEDLTPEDFQLLLDEYKQLTPEDYDGSVVHVGQPELEGGFLDPSKTTGEEGGIGDSGNTGALNLRTLELQREKQSRAEETASTWKAVMQSFVEDKKTFKPKTEQEADLLNGLFNISTNGYSSQIPFVIGEEFDLTEFYPRKDALIAELTRRAQDEDKRANLIAERFSAMEDGGKFGFLSAFPASNGVATQGYFGRNSGSVVPVNVATHLTEFEAGKFGGDNRRDFEKIKDRDMLYRWQLALRGTAYLVTDKKKITGALGPSEERQILGKIKPFIGISAPVRGYNPLTGNERGRDAWGEVASAIMARAIRLQKEGKEVNIENVLAARKGEPLRDVSQISRSGGLKSSTSAGRTAEILSRAKEKGIDIDYWEREQMPKRNNANLLTGDEQLQRGGYLEKLKQAVAEARAQGDDEKADIINQLYREVRNMTPEELNLAVEDALKRLPPQFSQQVSVQVDDPLGIIKRGRYLTVHDTEEMKKAGIEGLSERGNFHIETVIRSRSNTEAQFLNIEPSDISKDTRGLRPASGFVTSRMSEERRAKKLIEKYGPGVEIQHPYGVGETAGKNNGDMTQYGTSRIILKPEVAERSLVFQGDSISDTGSGSPALKLSTADDSANRGMWFNPVSILYADRTGDMDSIASPGSNLPRNGGGAPKYQEAMILGSFDTPDIAAIVVPPGDIRDSYGISSRIGIRIESSWNVTSIIRTAEKRDELSERGIDIVMDTPIFPLDEVEPFNPTMTRQWVQERIDSGEWENVTFDEIVPDESTTPYEVWLRYKKTGNGLMVFDHPDNDPGNDEKNKVNFSNMIDEELKRIESVKSKKKTNTQRSGGLSSQTSSGDETQKRLQEALKELEKQIEESKKPREREYLGGGLSSRTSGSDTRGLSSSVDEMTKRLQEALKELEKQIEENKKPREREYLGGDPKVDEMTKRLREASKELEKQIEKNKKPREREYLGGGLSSRTTTEKVDQGPSVLTHGRMPDGTPVVADVETLKSKFGSTKKDVQNYFEKTHGVKIRVPNAMFKEGVAGDQQGLVYGSLESQQSLVYTSLQALDDVLNNLDAQQLVGRDALTVSFDNYSFSDTPQGLFGPTQKWWSRTKLGQNKTKGTLEINVHQLSKYDQSGPRTVAEVGFLQSIWRDVIQPDKMSENMTAMFASLGIPDGFELNYPGGDSPDAPEWNKVAAVVQQRLAYAVMVHELGHYLDFSQRDDSDASIEPAMLGLARWLTTGRKPGKEDLVGIEEQIWSSSTPVAPPAFTDAPSPSVYGLLNNQEKLAEGFLSWFTLMGSTRSSMTVDGTLTEDYEKVNVRASESADFRKAISDIVTPLLDKLGPRVKSATPFKGASRTSETTKLPPAALLFAILPLVDMLKDKNSASAKMGRRHKRRITASDQKSAERNQESQEVYSS